MCPRETLRLRGAPDELGHEKLRHPASGLPRRFSAGGSGGVRALHRRLREFCKLAKENGQYFLFETGPETDQEIKKCIDMLGMDNVGINLDPANLLLYDKTEPLDFADTLGKYVLGVHCKDGRRPVDGAAMGRETPLGKGDAKFGEVMEKLYGLGFRGPLIIEREIPPGPEQDADIRSAMTYLHELRSRLMK